VPDLLQRPLALIAAVVTLPLVAVLAVAIGLQGGEPFFNPRRAGPSGPFRMFKLRTMSRGVASHGPAVTTRGDRRVTPLGAVLRRHHLDELPQLWNVVRGEMRLVGPRPEDPVFVDLDDPLQRLVLSAKPGITGLAQLVFADEADGLAGESSDDVYRTTILPRKLMVDAAYVSRRTLGLDLWIMVATLRALAGRPASPEEIARRVGGSLAGAVVPR
jgi:lipopolysaccharide/colanic/teichoic acid biosynthesis glycosyltransferase